MQADGIDQGATEFAKCHTVTASNNGKPVAGDQ